MILSVVSYGNSILKNETAEIGAGYPGLSQLISDMYETMYAASGVGLAAPQVNHSIRLFVVDASPFAEDDPFAGGFKKTFINAVILERSGKEVMYEEGCLSFPGFREEVIRPETIRIRYMDEQFQQQEDTYSGMLARIIQHEYDHVDGILIVDHLSNLRKVLVKRKLKEITLGEVKVAYRMIFPALKKKSTVRS